MNGPTIQELMPELNAAARRFAETYAPGGRYEGQEYVAPNPRGGSGKLGNFKINVSKKLFSAFNEGEAGNLFDMLVWLHNKDTKAAYRELLRFLNRDASAPPSDAAERERRAAEARARQEEEDRAIAETQARKRKAGQAQFLHGQRLVPGDPCWRYLEARGLNISELERAPRGLRYSRLKHPETGDTLHDCLLASVDNSEGFMTVHRTYLAERDGVMGKLFTGAMAQKSKLAYGAYKGGSIRIWRGLSNRPLARMKLDEEVVLTEGIENAIAVAIADPTRRVLSALSISNLGNVDLPSQCRRVLICADNDGDNAGANRGLDRAIGLLQQRDIIVRVAKPPAGIKDANDLFNADMGDDDA